MVQQVMFCISRFLKKDIFWIFLLRLAPNNYSCTIQPDTAVYSCLVLNLVVLVLFFFFPITLRDQGFVNNISEKHTRVKFHCRLLRGKTEIALVNHGWRLPRIKVLESRGKIPRTTAAWAWCASLVRVKSAASKFREQRCAHVEFYCSIGAPAVEPVFSKRCFSHGAPRDARARDFVNFRTL